LPARGHGFHHPNVGLTIPRGGLGRVVRSGSLEAQEQVRVGHGIVIPGIEFDRPVGHAEAFFNDRQVLLAQGLARRGIGKLPLQIGAPLAWRAFSIAW